MSTSDIIDLIGKRHTDDLFVPECKDGPTWGGGHFRLDAWAMARSWANPCFTGYEVKKSRKDFLGDSKWHNYLPLCNRLYFVCPWELIKPDDLPKEVGLLWVAKTGSRLFQKKPAVHRVIEPPVELMTYVLMTRVQVGRKWYEKPHDRAAEVEKWKRWLATEYDAKETGHAAAQRIARITADQLCKADADLKEAERQRKHAEEVVKALREVGIEISRWDVPRDVADRAAEARKFVTKKRLGAVKRALNELREICDEMDAAISGGSGKQEAA